MKIKNRSKLLNYLQNPCETMLKLKRLEKLREKIVVSSSRTSKNNSPSILERYLPYVMKN